MMLLTLKEYAIANKDNAIWTKSVGCGPLVIARLIDELVDDYNRTKTTLSEVENQRQIYYNECGEWDELGFPETPADMSEERVAELKALAEKWRKEDETDADGA